MRAGHLGQAKRDQLPNPRLGLESIGHPALRPLRTADTPLPWLVGIAPVSFRDAQR